MRQTFVALVDGTPGLVARVDALFRRQDVPLESLTFRDAQGSAPASVTVVAETSDETARLLVKHLRRLVDVRAVLAPVPGDEP
jgi:acetolactate synthase small subunit